LAQNRGEAPSPGLLRFACNPTSPQTRGEVNHKTTNRIVRAKRKLATLLRNGRGKNKNRSRGASSAPEAYSPCGHKAKSHEALPPAKEGSGAPKGALSNQCPRQARLRAALWRRAAFRRSRLRHSPPASTPMAQLQNRVSRGFDARVFARFAKPPRLSTLRADRSLCRSTGDPKPPECGAASSARGHRGSLSSLRHAFRKAPSIERDSLSVSELETNVNENVTAPKGGRDF